MTENGLTDYFIEHAGETVYISGRTSRDRRDAAIRKEYDKKIRGRSSCVVLDTLARKHDLSVRQIRRILQRGDA